MIQISGTVILMGAVQGIFFALLLLGIKQGQTSSNRILAAMLIVMSIGFISLFGAIVSKSQFLVGMFHVLILMITGCIPLLYLYVKTLTIKDFRFSPISLLHFLPIILGGLYPLIFKAPFYDLAEMLSLETCDHFTVVTIIWLLYAPPYLFSAHLLMKSHSRNIVEYYHDCRTVSRTVVYKLSVFVWIRTLLTTGWVFWLLSIASLIYRGFAEYCSFITLVTSSMIYLLGFLGLRRDKVFYPPDSSYIKHDTKLNGGTQ